METPDKITANKTLITRSNQDGIHKDLEIVVKKHLSSKYLRPIADHTQSAFDFLVEKIDISKPIVFDSGCGTGESSTHLSKTHPQATVIGIDRSLHRIEKGRKLLEVEKNVLLIRAELSDFWRLALNHKIYPKFHYILYPNPYPKKQHLKRRWHAHPIFPTILALGGKLTLRSDWKIYLDEFNTSLKIAGRQSSGTDTLKSSKAITPFEKKYIEQKRDLYELTTNLKKAVLKS